MLKSLVSLPTVISDLYSARRSHKKRQQSNRSKSLFAAIEDLEIRQLMSAANTASDDAFTPRIINGSAPASGVDLTGVAKLTFTPTGGSAVLSSGTFITTQWILTSASASKGLTEAGGIGKVTIGTTDYVVDDVVPYDKYKVGSGDFTQDIALWHITAAASGVTPIDIARSPAAAKATVTLAGYGLPGTTTAGASGSYGTLLTGQTTIERVTPSQYTWKLDGTEATSASGDTGGPVLTSKDGVFKISGIASTHSTTTSKKGDIASNTRVDIYAGWIDSITSTTAPTPVTPPPLDEATAGVVADAEAIYKTFTLTSKIKSLDAVGKIGILGDLDVYKVVTPSDGIATFNLQNTSPGTVLFDTVMDVYDSLGVLVTKTVVTGGVTTTPTVGHADDVAKTNLNSQLVVPLAAGTYYVKVSSYNNYQTGSYHLTMTEKYSAIPTPPPPPATPADVTGIAQLTYTPTTGTPTPIFSTGVLIGSTTILTSASASKGLEVASGASVKIGSTTYVVDAIDVYDKYNASASGDNRQDIAVWTLHTAPSGATPLAIETPLASPALAAGATVTLAGFGSTALNSSGVPVYGSLSTITRKVERLTGAQLSWKLTNALELSNAAGDTGGAVLKSTTVGGTTTYSVIGIASTVGTTQTAINGNSVNTRVDQYAAWLSSKLGVSAPVLGSFDDQPSVSGDSLATYATTSLTLAKPSAQVTGKLESYGDVDVFKLQVSDAGIVNISVASQSPSTVFLDTKLRIVSLLGTEVAINDDVTPGSDLSSQIATYLTAGTYFVEVSAYRNEGVGAYRLSYTQNVDTANNTVGAAQVLAPNSIGSATINTYINSVGDVDFFSFTANKTGKYQFDFENVDPSSLDAAIIIVTSTGVPVSQNDNYTASNKNARLINVSLVSGTTYYVAVTGVSTTTGGVTSGGYGLGKLTIKKTAN